MTGTKQRQTVALTSSTGETITTASRIGNLLCSSSIPGIDPATGKLGEGPEAQFAFAFQNAKALVQKAGLSPDEIGHITVFIPGQGHRQYINPPWLDLFPGENRPARKTTQAGLPAGQEIQLQLFAVPGARREPVEIPGLAHRDPLPMAARMGDLLFSSVLGPDIPGSDQRAEGQDQIVQTFSNIKTLVEVAGGAPGDIGLVWVYLGEWALQEFMVETWVNMFPQDGDRPSRKTFPYDLGGRSTLIQAQMISVLGSKRSNYEVPGIGHHDPIPLGNRQGDYFFTSGITGSTPGSGKLVDGGAEAQMARALENLSLLLKEAGGTMDDIVHVTTLLGDQSLAGAAQAAWDKVYPNAGNSPAHHMMQLGLPGRDTLVQIHAIGVL